MKSKEPSIQNALKKVGDGARKKAFRQDMPVAVSENGVTMLKFPDGTTKPFSSKEMADLKHGKGKI